MMEEIILATNTIVFAMKILEVVAIVVKRCL